MTVVLFAVATAARSSDAPPAQELLDDVVARLPREALTVSGELIVRRRKGVELRRLGFEMYLNWGVRPSIARYTIRDAFGGDLERLTVERDARGLPTFRYAAGSPLAPAETPPLFDTVQQSDISWMDLALSFLWWPDGELVGRDEVKGRRCFVVRVPAPASVRGGVAGASASSYDAVRLWIDEEMRMLLQAEGLDTDGSAVRRLWVRSFKKIDDRWMIKDMEVESYPVASRTKLHVSDVSAADTAGPHS
jgi:hypothetical protein